MQRDSEMSDRKKWIKILEQLWQGNARVNNYYRMATGAVRNPKLKSVLLKYATSRAQFSFELSQRIRELGGEISRYGNNSTTNGAAISLHLSEENIGRILQKSIRAEGHCFEEYSEALTRVNDGVTREILIRHRARISSIIREMQHLDALLPLSGAKENTRMN